MDSEEYSITWIEHPRNVVEVFARFLEEEVFVDCTIAAEGEHLKAHKLMLSACSPYFELLFRQEMMKDKVLVLEDIRFEDLKSLIEFMYRGQVIVPKERLQAFVRAAESLQIKGLPSDLVHNLQSEVTEMSVVRGRDGLASHLSHKSMRYSAVVGEICELQSENRETSSIGKKQSGVERSLSRLQTDLPEENVCPQPQCVLRSDTNRGTAVFSVNKYPLMEPKEEVDIEDTPIWESEDENNCRATDLFTSITASDENRNQLTSNPDSVRCSYGSSTSPLILENKSESSLPSFSSVSASFPSSENTAAVPNIPTEQRGGAIVDSSSCVQKELREQSVWIKNEPPVKTEEISPLVSSHNESTVEPMHEVWLEEMRSWEEKREIITTYSAVICNLENTNQDQDVAVAAAFNCNHSAVRPHLTFEAFVSSCIVAEGEKKNDNVEDVKVEEPEISKHCLEQECERIEVYDSTVDKVDENGQCSIINIDENVVKKEELVMVETVEETLENDSAEEQNEEEEDFVPLSERVSKMLGKEWPKPSRCPDVSDTVGDEKVQVRKQQRKESCNRCEVCMATFAYMTDLARHKRTHTDERPFECDVCRRSFTQKGHLSVHKRTHTGERPYQCDVCRKSFNERSILTVHKRSHTGERPFECNVCGKSFSNNGNLTRHKLIHTGERPFQCDVCKMTFNQVGTLTVHKRTHTGERPFQCEVCGMSFSDQSNLNGHKRTHTGERPFQCDNCGRLFSHKRSLTIHIRSHTGEPI